MLRTLDELNKIVMSYEQADENVALAEARIDDVHRIEAEAIKSWNTIEMLLTDMDEIEKAIETETKIKLIILTKIAHAKSFIAKHKRVLITPSHSSTRLMSAPSDRNGSVRLEKMRPPRFSGNIRNFARFRADFEAVVMPAYDDMMHQVYVLKETCLHGSAYELVRKLDDLDEIWKRLSERYGDCLDIVDLVIKDIQDVVIPKFNQEQGFVTLVDVLEKGLQDLTAIGKRREIANAYTVKLIEQKLPRRVMLRWLEEEEKGDSFNRFESLLTYLKKGEQRKLWNREMKRNEKSL